MLGKQTRPFRNDEGNDDLKSILSAFDKLMRIKKWAK